ncbi:lysoplasmalogenase [Romboutsia sp. 1001713B170207_170306_H8]|uniref:lysoplasmalogenase n=1 Tax=Romboutsia sp. 1001713B170207_170306_H8 TaxID=2787112 RepID=UPI000822A60C|nr:YhhN-like protein [uncultured Clostridium sp.]
MKINTLYIKILASLLFLVICISSYLYSKSNFLYFILLLIGLFCSFLGDIFLGIQSKNKDTLGTQFIFGIISFSLTHIFYISSFSYIYPFNIKDLLLSFIMLFIIIAFLKYRKDFDFQDFFILSCIYAWIISLMFCKCISTCLFLGKSTISVILIMGSSLFVISDVILSFIVFGKSHIKYLSIFNLITYYIGQILIASSVLFI